MSVREKEELKGEHFNLIIFVGSFKIKRRRRKETPQYLETVGDFKNHCQNKYHHTTRLTVLHRW